MHLAKSSPWRASGCRYPSCWHTASRILLRASTSSSGVMHGKGRGRDDRAHNAACGHRSPLPALHPGRSRMLMSRLRAPPLAAFAPCCSTTPQPPRPLAASVPCCSTPPQPLRPWGHRAFAAQGRRTPSCSTARGCCSSAARVAAAICDLDPGGVGRRGDDETRM